MNCLIMFHTPVNAGYAMKKLEQTFFDVMCEITGSQDNVYFSFVEYSGEKCESLPEDFTNIFELNEQSLSSPSEFEKKCNFLKERKIDLALCFDLQVSGKMVDLLRKSGIANIVSYWGSTISGRNSGLKLLLKRLEVAFSSGKPDLFIFESEAMRELAVFGRGISKKITQVIPTGVDTDKLKPDEASRNYLNETFGIEESKRIAIYSGHMEERKGVSVIVNAFKHLSEELDNNEWYMLICGNRPGEEDRFLEMLDGSPAAGNVKFCGYRKDLDKMMPGCDLGIIASTGWDSFPMSSLEMAACGLPVLASNLQGLTETIRNEETGLLFEPGNHSELAQLVDSLTHDSERLNLMSTKARERILNNLSVSIQKSRLKKSLVDLIDSRK